MGTTERFAPDRWTSPGDSERPGGGRGRVPPGARAVDALLFLGGELEAAAAGAEVSDAPAPALPCRGASRADGTECSDADDRKAGRAARRRPGRVRSDRGHDR